MAVQYLYAAFANLLTAMPGLIALAAGIVISAMKLRERPKTATAGLIAFSGFFLLELVLPFVNYTLMGFLVRAERLSSIATIQAIMRILSSVAAAVLWASFIYGLFFAQKKDSEQ